MHKRLNVALLLALLTGPCFHEAPPQSMKVGPFWRCFSGRANRRKR